MFGQPSHLRAALRLALEGARRGRAAAREAPGVPRRKLAIEHRAIRVEPARVRRFLAATGGTGVAALQGEGAPLPPTFSAVWETAMALELLTLDGAPFPARGLIHLESELVCVRPLYPGDRIRCRLELDRAEPHPRGVRLALKIRNWNAADQLCQENLLVILVRAAGSPPAPAGGEGAEGGSAPDEWRELATWRLPATQGFRYARASGDFNPIHLWAWSSRLFGFDRPILHGYCTEALVAHTLVDRVLDGDPRALRRLRIRFRAPLSLPARVRLLVSRGGAGGRFRVVRAVEDEGRGPYAEGEFVGG